MGRPRKVKVEEVPTAPEVEAVSEIQPHVVSRPTDGTVNDRISPELPSLNDPGQS